MTIFHLIGYIGGAALVLTLLRFFLNKPSNLLVSYFQDFVGVLFIFSGSVKAIDPLGTAYKMGDYFTELNLPKFEPYVTELAVFMIVLEILLGVALLLGWKKNFTLFILFGMIVFFTFLTGFTYLSGWHFNGLNPADWKFVKTDMKVTDCGCFGDFLKLEPKVSFIKDVFLTIMILVLIWGRKHIQSVFGGAPATASLALVAVASFFYCLSNFVWDLPQFDFRPYAVGKNIPKQQEFVPPTMKYKFFYKNESTGEVEGFVYPDKPGDGWVKADKEREDIIIDEGVPAIISNFQLVNEDGDLMDDQILYNEDYTFMVVAYKLEKTDKEAFTEKINPIASAAEKDGYMFFVATASDAEKFRHDVQADYPFYSGDATFLKTIIRSNPGLLILKNGTVVAKWHHRHIPEYSDIKSEYLK